MYHKLLFLVTKRNTVLILYFHSLVINYNVLSNIYTKLNYFNFNNTFVIRNISVFDIYLNEPRGAIISYNVIEIALQYNIIMVLQF